jgi:hypothetical protein
MPVHGDIDGIIQHARINLNSAETLTRGLSQQQFNWRPEPGRWSVGQCLTHLNLVNGGDLTRLAAAVSEAKAQGVTGAPPFRYGWFAQKFVNMMEPPITKKFGAPKMYQPPPDVEVVETLAEYRRIQAELLQIVESARGLHLGRVKTALTGVPLIKIGLGARFSLLATHDTRHLWQADQVLKAPGFPVK